MSFGALECEAERFPDWTPLDDGFQVEMLELIFDNPEGRFGVGIQELSADETAWRWRLWEDVWPTCRQANLEGLISARPAFGRVC